ncbi:MAG: hypothetical protein V4613_08800 [Bacteroidota bacterium]
MTRILTAIFVLLTLNLFADNKPVPVGNWRVHLNYQDVRQIAEVGTKIYCASKNGLFVYNKDGGATERLSPINGFYGYAVDALHYSEAQQTLLIAYSDGVVEMLKGNTITRNMDIKRKTIVGDKTIYSINSSGSFAYFSTSYGILEYNYLKNEFRNWYENIGPGGSKLPVFSTAILHDTLFATTTIGILQGSLSPSVNLSNFGSWTMSRTSLIRSKHIASFNDNLFAESDSLLLKYSNGTWSLFEPDSGYIISNINVMHDKLIVGVYGKHIITLDKNNAKTYTNVNELNQCLLDADNGYWHAHKANGLVAMAPGGNINFYPNGPGAPDNFAFLNAYGKLYCTAGAFSVTTYAPAFNNNRYYSFDNYNWENCPRLELTDTLYDFTYMAYNQNNKRLYIATHSKGLVQLDNGVATKVYNNSNSPLAKRANLFCIVSGLALDKNNNLWMSNYDVDSPMLQLSNKGVWSRYKLPSQAPGAIHVDSKNNKWIITPRSNTGMVFLNDKGTPTKADDVILPITTSKGNGNLPSNFVTAIAFTKGGEMVVGTDLGYGRIRTPGNIATGGNFDFERIIVSVEEGTSLGGYLLEKEYINCITIDGADRRWIGTNNGAWLLDSDGETILQHFTKDNSPLLSDNVLSIGIMESSGEVFFGTDLGIISYRSNALSESKNLTEIKIYPNPVRPDFDGDIAITGLKDNTLVKITDINGLLVYQTYSNGGMATWNCRTFDGTRPATGVYLAFCVTEDGGETGLGKILFIK